MKQFLKFFIAGGGFLIVILAAGICAGAPADTMKWKHYGETAEFSFYYNPEETGFLQRMTDRFKPKVVKVWTNRVAKGEKGRDRQIEDQKKDKLSVKGYEDYAYTMSYREISCSDKTMRTLSEADYTKMGEKLDGYNQTPEAARWLLIVPETPEASLYGILCTPGK